MPRAKKAAKRRRNVIGVGDSVMIEMKLGRPLKTPIGTLTEHGAAVIRQMRAHGFKLSTIAERVGVSVQAVWNLLNGRTKTWSE